MLISISQNKFVDGVTRLLILEPRYHLGTNSISTVAVHRDSGDFDRIRRDFTATINF